MTKSAIETRISEIDGEMTALQNDIDTSEWKISGMKIKKDHFQAERDKLETLIEEGDYEQDDSEK